MVLHFYNSLVYLLKMSNFVFFVARLFIIVLIGEFIICTLSILFTGALGIMESDSRYSLEIIKKQNLKVIFHCKKVSGNNASKEEKHQNVMRYIVQSPLQE